MNFDHEPTLEQTVEILTHTANAMATDRNAAAPVIIAARTLVRAWNRNWRGTDLRHAEMALAKAVMEYDAQKGDTP